MTTLARVLCFTLTHFVTVAISLVTGCQSPVDVTRELQLGTKLPQQVTEGVYISRVGAGSYEQSIVPVPWIEADKSCQILTDENGIVTAKAFQTDVQQGLPMLLISRKTHVVMELDVPPEWRSLPARWPKARCINGEVATLRQSVASASDQTQPQLLRKWEKLEAPPLERNILDYLMLVSLKTVSVPIAKKEPDSFPFNCLGDNIVDPLVQALSTRFKNPSDARILISPEGTWTASTSDGHRVQWENLGGGRCRVTVEYSHFMGILVCGDLP